MIENLKEEIRNSIMVDKNPCEEMIMSKLDEIIQYPLSKDILFVVKTLVEIISVVQGQVDALLEMCIKQEIEIKLLQKQKGE